MAPAAEGKLQKSTMAERWTFGQYGVSAENVGPSSSVVSEAC